MPLAPSPETPDVPFHDIHSGCPSSTFITCPPYLPCSQEAAAPPLGAPDETPGFSWQPPHTPPSHEQTLPALLPTHPGPRHSHPCPHPAALGTGHSLLAGLALMPPIVYPPWGARPSHPLRSPPCPLSSLPVGARVPKTPAAPGHCPPSPASSSPTHSSCPQDRSSLGRVPQAFGFCPEAAPWTHPIPWAPAFTVAAWTWRTDMFMASQPHQAGPRAGQPPVRGPVPPGRRHYSGVQLCPSVQPPHMEVILGLIQHPGSCFKL